MPPRPVVLPSATHDPGPARRARLAAAAQTLTEALASRPRFRDVQVHAFMKAMPARIVAEATLRGQPCFIKMIVGRHAEAAIREMCAELRFAEANMAPDASLRVARILDAVPRIGVIVLEAAPGQRLDDAVEAAGPARRRALHRRGGEWLAWYCAPRREARAFDPARFLDSHEVTSRLPAHVGEIPRQDRERMAALAACIEGEARRLRGKRVSIAASHGDFLPRNAHVSGKVVTAYDIDGLRRVPVASDAARFLVHQQMRQGADPGESLTCGLTRADWSAFLESGVLDAEEEAALLPLYVAQQMQVELPATALRPNWQRRLRRSIDTFLAGPKTLAVWLAQLGLILPPVI